MNFISLFLSLYTYQCFIGQADAYFYPICNGAPDGSCSHYFHLPWLVPSQKEKLQQLFKESVTSDIVTSLRSLVTLKEPFDKLLEYLMQDHDLDESEEFDQPAVKEEVSDDFKLTTFCSVVLVVLAIYLVIFFSLTKKLGSVYKKKLREKYEGSIEKGFKAMKKEVM